MFLFPRSHFPQVELIHQITHLSAEPRKKKFAINVPQAPSPQGYTHRPVRPDPVDSKSQRRDARLQTAPQVSNQPCPLNTGESVRHTPTTNQVKKTDVHLSSAPPEFAGRGLIAFSLHHLFSPPLQPPPWCLSLSLVGRTVKDIS